jgi:hypothetical protein
MDSSADALAGFEYDDFNAGYCEITCGSQARRTRA